MDIQLYFHFVIILLHEKLLQLDLLRAVIFHLIFGMTATRDIKLSLIFILESIFLSRVEGTMSRVISCGCWSF